MDEQTENETFVVSGLFCSNLDFNGLHTLSCNLNRQLLDTLYICDLSPCSESVTITVFNNVYA